jgi:23S rRNA (guanosine2251-2'-O)-methyltransferase
VSPPRERNDRSKPYRPPTDGHRNEPPGRPSRAGPRHGDRASAAGGSEWIWGWHAVHAALANPEREDIRRIVCTSARLAEVAALTAGRPLRIDTLESAEIARLLAPGAVHQGAAVLAPPIEPKSLEELAFAGAGVIVMLDQVTDPQNVGAIFRSAAAFGAQGVIVQDRRAPALTGALAKAAAGAIDKLPHARVVNLSRALEQLSDLGWRSVGLAGAAEQPLEAVLDGRPTVLVLGSEGDGLRRLVADHCDALARIAMPGGFESLNVSNAAAVALYAACRARQAGA